MFEFIETPFFTKALPNYLADDEYCELQQFLNEHPESGAVVPGSGGVRKLRWSLKGQGKRGGLRVIWMITIYSKNIRENIPAHMLKQMKEALEKWAR